MTTMLLADHGADVIRIERRVAPQFAGPPPPMRRDTRAVLGGLGYVEAPIAALFESGAARSDQ